MNAVGQKKAWQRPKLTVLVRIDLAESVLVTCKWNAPTGASQANNRCRITSWDAGICGACNESRES